MIDKSIRADYDIKNRRRYFTGAFGGAGAGRGRDPGGPPGGGDRGMTYTAPPPSQDRQDRARQQAAIEQAAAEQRAAEQRVEAERQEAERANQLAEARRLMTQPTTVDVPTKGPKLIPGTTHPFTVDPYQQNYISPGQVRTEGIYNEGDYADLVKAPVDVGFQEALRKQQIATDLRQKQQDPDYGQFFRPQPVVEKPKSGIGGALKTAGKGILEMALMPFLPKPVRTAFTGYKRAKQLEDIAKRTGILDKDIVPTLNLSNLRSTIDKGVSGRQFDPKDPIGWTGEKKRTFHEPRDGQQETTIQEAVAGKKPLGIDFEDLREKQNVMKNALDEGWYLDKEGKKIQLTDQQKEILNSYITRIDKYLVDPTAMAAYGGRIDKPLAGRSRDI